MNDQEFIESIANNPIVRLGVDEIEGRVAHLKQSGMRYIQRQMPWYWRKEDDSFTLSANDHTVNLRSKFRDFYIPKFFWTSEGEMELWPEKKFRRTYPNPTDTGTPTIYVPLTQHIYRFHPIPASDTTINLAYLFVPKGTRIAEIPEEYHDVLEYYVLMFLEPKESFKYAALFKESIRAMIQDARPSEEFEPEIIIDDLTRDLEITRVNLER